jgi:hypothetical protein
MDKRERTDNTMDKRKRTDNTTGLICNHYKLSNCRNWPDILPGKISGVDIN